MDRIKKAEEVKNCQDCDTNNRAVWFCETHYWQWVDIATKIGGVSVRSAFEMYLPQVRKP